MSVPLLKLAMKAKGLREVAIVGRVLLGFAGVLVLVPVVSNLRDPSALSIADYIGLTVFSAVGLWLLHVAMKGR